MWFAALLLGLVLGFIGGMCVFLIGLNIALEDLKKDRLKRRDEFNKRYNHILNVED